MPQRHQSNAHATAVPTVIIGTKCRAQILKIMPFALKFQLFSYAQIKEV
jgi:hypothetical protein